VSSANSAYIDAVLAKCQALKLSKVWPDESVIRPRGWLDNFDDANDKTAAAVLLDGFTFFSSMAKVRLLVGAFESASRTPAKSPRALPPNFFRDAVFTPVLGETPNLTDSGAPLSRLVRQHLEVAEDRFVPLPEAITRAQSGTPVCFVDDVTQTGDQFIETWTKQPTPTSSFAALAATTGVNVACVYILADADATLRITRDAPQVRVYSMHTPNAANRYPALMQRSSTPLVPNAQSLTDALISKFAPRLTFRLDDSYMHNAPTWASLGYKDRGLMVAFEGNVPDGSLPIFWATGPSNGSREWIPLVRRS
jgi:hypothetical protein